jgi:hypothetical protein
LFWKYALMGLLVPGGLISAGGVLAQETAGRIDSQHSTVSLLVISSRHSEAAIKVGVARASGVIDGSVGDSAPSGFDFTLYPAGKTGLPDRSEPRHANDADYTVIHFRAKRVIPSSKEAFLVVGDLTLTHVQQLATYTRSEAYDRPVYGPAVTDSVTQSAVFEFHRVAGSRARRSTAPMAGWFASATVNGEGFPELLHAVSSTRWPTLVADEKGTPPANAGEGFFGPVRTGTAIEVAGRADVRCEVPLVGEDFAGAACKPAAAPMNGNTQVRRTGSGEQIVANEVEIQLDLQLTNADSPASVGSGQ